MNPFLINNKYEKKHKRKLFGEKMNRAGNTAKPSVDLEIDWFTCARKHVNGAGALVNVEPKYRSAFYILNHPRGKEITRGRGFQVYVDGKKERFDGLTSQLSSMFHPCERTLSTGGQKTGGARRGCLVDKEIENLVNHGRLPESGTLHIYTVKTLQHLYKHNLQPFACQVPVYDKALKIATDLDILCIDLSAPVNKDEVVPNNVINIQLKTGFENNNYSVPFGYFVSPLIKTSALRGISDSYHTRHQLQLLLETTMLKQLFPRCIRGSRILVISSSRHSSYPLDQIILGLYSDIHATLLARRDIPPWQVKGEAAKAEHIYKKAKKMTGH